MHSCKYVSSYLQHAVRWGTGVRCVSKKCLLQRGEKSSGKSIPYHLLQVWYVVSLIIHMFIVLQSKNFSFTTVDVEVHNYIDSKLE